MDVVDYTGGKTLAEIADELEQRGITFAIAEADPDVRRELDRFGVTAKIEQDREFERLADARAAFQRA